MVASNFAPSLAAVLVHEGGYFNHPRDPGGPTMKGVIKRVYDDYRRSKGLPTRDVRQLEESELQEIYRRRYWDLIQGDKLPAGIDYVVFDGAVNSGPAQATKWLQRALGIAADGVLGPATIAALERAEDHDAVIADIQARRLAMLKNLKTWDVFGKGWGRRVAEAKQLGQAIASGSVHLPMPTATACGKAYASSAKSPPPKAIGDALASGGTVSTGIGVATDALVPVADKSAMAATILTILMVAGALVAVLGYVYREWAKAKAAEIMDALDLKAPDLGSTAEPAEAVPA
ncbi:glycoside hydrolase family 108 protein [Xanthobacter tagetidis]|uniref:N-acetylmuramidase n=1 Tax=Xanthobacter tagetidis TaxID=60216 RepID=A0A3L7AJB5_9HYPH|nr:glycosyl hydrolase 108 family protein [Xanthobacter tagetidis]MBB6308894.1 lysozyme family protein [Xanthobacter tagetidis]RLP80593.1 N-acetylmuramidase [Xanthobacter tagetidis]